MEESFALQEVTLAGTIASKSDINAAKTAYLVRLGRVWHGATASFQPAIVHAGQSPNTAQIYGLKRHVSSGKYQIPTLSHLLSTWVSHQLPCEGRALGNRLGDLDLTGFRAVNCHFHGTPLRHVLRGMNVRQLSIFHVQGDRGVLGVL